MAPRHRHAHTKAKRDNAPDNVASGATAGDDGPQPPAQSANVASEVTPEQWNAMSGVLTTVYAYREDDGYDPSKIFQRSVNKRFVPDYYDVIKEPMALSVVKSKIRNKEYPNFSVFVRDCALIPHNAQTYNRPMSRAYDDAITINNIFISEFRKLAREGIISAAEAELPDLGEIPEADPLPVPQEEEEEEEDDDDDEEAEDTDDDGRRKKKKVRMKHPNGENTDTPKPSTQKRRGRPPRVDTPMEGRIKSVLKGLRRMKDNDGNLKILPFEKLPDKSVYPDYFTEIKEPMAIDIMKRKCKRKKYGSMDQFVHDIDLMFNNAKAYNQPQSRIYKDAAELLHEAHVLAEQEKKRPDTDFLLDDGRLPLPNGILYNGELWKVGDWIHIRNPNDANKPIIAQIFRTWQDVEDQKWVNCCWYYRPEQSVHHVDKRFYENEVMKTGQYRDHRVEDIVDRCFVMFINRYIRGRPRGFPAEKTVYVCEARYNEEKHRINKIKTWASCLPDEVRDKDYELDIFDNPLKLRKFPSPIKHLLLPNAKETDRLPRPSWNTEKGPPVVGAVHCRPRDENESPPPEQSPTPLHMPGTPATTDMTPMYSRPSLAISTQSPVPSATPSVASYSTNQPSPYVASTPPLAAANIPPRPYPAPPNPQYRHPLHPQHQPPLTPAVAYHNPSAAAYTNNRAPSHYVPGTPPQLMYQHPAAAAAAAAGLASPSGYAPPPHNLVPGAAYPGYRGPAAGHSPYIAPMPGVLPPRTAAASPLPISMFNSNAPRGQEVFVLSDEVNAKVPRDLRDKFQCDEHGRILFFLKPPLDPDSMTRAADGEKGETHELAHSTAYISARENKKKNKNEPETTLNERKRKTPASTPNDDHATKHKRLKKAPEEKARGPKTGTESTAVPSMLSSTLTPDAPGDQDTALHAAVGLLQKVLEGANTQLYQSEFGTDDEAKNICKKQQTADLEEYKTKLQRARRADLDLKALNTVPLGINVKNTMLNGDGYAARELSRLDLCSSSKREAAVIDHRLVGRFGTREDW